MRFNHLEEKNLCTSYINVYSPIPFDERVTLWLQFVPSLPCACAYVAFIICACGSPITITQSHTHTMQQTHRHKVVTECTEAKKLLSRWRQSDYRFACDIWTGIPMWVITLQVNMLVPSTHTHSQILITSGTQQPVHFRVLHHVLMKDTGWFVYGTWGTRRSPSLLCTCCVLQ